MQDDSGRACRVENSTKPRRANGQRRLGYRPANFVGVLLAFALCATAARAQVVAVFEIKDPGARRLQQTYSTELNAIGAELQAHKFPYSFYFSRQLDIDEKQQQKLDQQSIRFDKYNGKLMLEITGNYYAAYSDRLMDAHARMKKTYEDVVLPILKATVQKFPPDDSFAGFAVEVSYHVRKRIAGIETENPENLTLILPRAAAHHLVTATSKEQQQAALLDGEVYRNAEPALLWLTGDPPPDWAGRKNKKTNLQASLATLPPDPAPSPSPTVSPSLLQSNSLPVRLITPDVLTGLKSAHAATIARMVSNLDAQAHFVSYAPPSFVAFHQGAYLQLSIQSQLTTNNGSRYQLAALAFDDHIAHLIRPVLAYFPEDGGFDGVCFSTTLSTRGSQSSEAVEFFFPFPALRCFANYDCTGQQLIDAAVVLINGERAGLNLQAAEAIATK
jgi:hypothetical protein